ncbi:MAG: antibiotic acetyltransferase, partial [Firmicutes bacterium]|nr:antibiotic acetyltransferase [Bacillota bacterium]
MNKLLYLWSKILKKLRGSALKNCNIHPTSKVESGCNLVNVNMDKYSFCGYNCEISHCDIGAFTSIANGVIIGGGMHPIDWVGMSP